MIFITKEAIYLCDRYIICIVRQQKPSSFLPLDGSYTIRLWQLSFNNIDNNLLALPELLVSIFQIIFGQLKFSIMSSPLCFAAFSSALIIDLLDTILYSVTQQIPISFLLESFPVVYLVIICANIFLQEWSSGFYTGWIMGYIRSN